MGLLREGKGANTEEAEECGGEENDIDKLIVELKRGSTLRGRKGGASRKKEEGKAVSWMCEKGSGNCPINYTKQTPQDQNDNNL